MKTNDTVGYINEVIFKLRKLKEDMIFTDLPEQRTAMLLLECSQNLSSLAQEIGGEVQELTEKWELTPEEIQNMEDGIV